MKSNKLMLAIGLVLLASLVLAACQPVVTTVEVTKEVKVVETQLVEKIVESTTIVEVERKPFTTPDPVTSDVRVRQAMAYCTDKAAVANAGYPLASREQAEGLVMNTFIPKTQWAYAGDENVTIYPFDVEKGGALLEEAGWALNADDGMRYNANGEPLVMKFATTTAAFRQAWAAVWQSQMQACGIQILRSHVPASWWFGDTTGLARRDFQLGAFAWVGQADPGGQSLYSCEQIPSPDNGWTGQNYMGWCNQAASDNIKKANNTLVQAERKAAYTIVQQEFTKDVPSIPLFNRTETFSRAADLEGFAPTPGQEYYVYNIEAWVRPDTDTIVIGFTQEPASLYTLVEDAFVARLATFVIDPLPYFSLNYTYTPNPVLYKGEFASFDNGGATKNEVEVKEGDLVIDSSGTPAALASGVKVLDSTGTEVEFTGTPIKMTQITATYTFNPDLTWSDGVKIAQADFELAYKTVCDKESGATTFIVCDSMGNVTFDGTNYTVAWKPGRLDPFYYIPPIGWYPAHRVIESEGPNKGKTLGEVAPKDMLTLPEIAENPIGVGPYMIESWEKGQQINYVANPYWIGPAVKTPKLVIRFVTAENAEAQLLAGEVDLLGSETLAGLTETLVKAEAEGTVKNYLVAGATWEHIDINMWIR